MAECECLGGCIFFNDQMKSFAGVKEIMKQKYCKGDSSMCARHLVFAALGKPRVPADLIPNEIDRAQSLIAAG
jgi:hypothetical protein